MPQTELLPSPVAGLEGVVAAETRLSAIHGDRGELLIGGIPVDVLAPRAVFEETVELLWNVELPTRDRLAELRRSLAEMRGLPEGSDRLIGLALRRATPPIDALALGLGLLRLEVADAPGTWDRSVAERLVAFIPTWIAAYERRRRGLEPVPPDPSLGHAANFLYMLDGEAPSAARVRALDTYLNTVVDHGMNASTFTARVIASTHSDLVSAVVGALGALKGPLHGGAPGPALDMVFEIGSAERAEPLLREKLERGERLMGFGHRVYRVRDPRADVLAEAARRLATNGEQRGLFELATSVEQTALRLLRELKPQRRLDTNVEFYTALVLHAVGLPSDLFTPVFAMSRSAGWLAHCREQLAQGKLLRPASRWVGELRSWTPLEQRLAPS